MSEILKYLVNQYHNAERDPRTRHWFMVFDSPVPVWIATGLYILMVLIGPRIMKNRRPFSLQSVMVIYNMGLVFLSMYMFIEILLSVADAGYGVWCGVYNKDTWKNPKEMRVANVLWVYFISKLIEFNDTLLMILRKKFDQISFLHVFHHATMLNIWWWAVMFIPGGMSWFSSCLNSLVHIVMYSYYGLSAIPALRGKLWWKRYITRFQLIQFCCMFLHSTNAVRIGCDFPLWGQTLLTSYVVILICLFGNFYVQAYLKRGKRNSRKEANGFAGSSVNGMNAHGHENGFTNGHAQVERE